MELNLKAEQQISELEKFKFNLIKGYERLFWKGKRPFESTCYYPAQLKETHGVETEGWLNKIFWGDNLQVMSHLLKTYRGQVDLIYIDPPFDSKADYKKKIELRGQKAESDSSNFEEVQYTDIWSNDEYLQFMYERLILMRELLSDKGSIYLHCDWHKVHLLRCIMDEVFGANMLRNEIIWSYRTAAGSNDEFNKQHDNVLLYTKTEEHVFNPMVEKSYTKAKGRKAGIVNYGAANTEFFEDEFGVYRWSSMRDVWDIPYINSQAIERLGYPTQKPEALIERIIKASSKPGDLVFDCFMGSGTTQAVAMKLGRKFIGADINLGAIETTTKRLLKIQQEEAEKLNIEGDKKYLGFEVYNVNDYDIFNNPATAKDLLMQALELQPISNSLYDGEKDGRMVKILPINRIATRQDLNDLITNFPYRAFDERRTANPGKPVEFITLVCMGHESDLGGQLKLEMETSGYNIDVQVVDILRDRKDIVFKRDSEAKISTNGGKLNIEEFYPMNLLQKLSMEKQSISDWRELVDSIKIDFNYDGAVFQPSMVDIPEKAELVKGVYNIPDNAGTIRVKITDLISESLEITVNN